jgi:hypothetical protein
MSVPPNAHESSEPHRSTDKLGLALVAAVLVAIVVAVVLLIVL